MPFANNAGLILSAPLRSAKKKYLQLRVEQLRNMNAHSERSVVRPGGPVVSLTSYGGRVETAFAAIESIGRGTLLPSELILWLDDEEQYRCLPETLERLKGRGLSVRLSKNYGPHTKYYPYLESQKSFVTPLVTADDDIFYPSNWLSTLMEAFRRAPGLVHCFRARIISVRNGQIAPYAQWELCRSTDPSWRHLLNGVSGVIYPPQLLEALQRAGSGFQECCPRADDVWLHANALRAGFKIQQISRRATHFPIIPGTQASALYFHNVAVGNDAQIAKTYSQADFQRMSE
jgi:hypothetical protein